MAIITISREMGTGAYRIAKDVARKLKYTLVDGEKIDEVAPSYGLDSTILQRVDEKPPAYVTADDREHAAWLHTIELILLEFARKGNVILYGRGAQDLMEGLGSVLRVRFIAPFDERVENFAEREWIDPDLARELIRKSDHQRAGFIRFYFDRDWNDPMGYDLICNTSRLSHGAIVDSIVSAARDPRFAEAEEECREVLEEIILCKRVETALARSGRIENLHFRVAADRDEISLTGHVYTQEEKAAAVQVARGVEGVSRVHDRLSVIAYRKYGA